jgi:hypothetical protein
VPLPLALFPLTAGSLASLTLPQYNGTSVDTLWTYDPSFQSVMRCSRVRIPHTKSTKMLTVSIGQSVRLAHRPCVAVCLSVCTTILTAVSVPGLAGLSVFLSVCLSVCLSAPQSSWLHAFPVSLDFIKSVCVSVRLQEAQSYAKLDPVPYAQNGAFAVNLWFKTKYNGSDSQTGLQYLYSNVEDPLLLTATSPNQVSIASELQSVCVCMPAHIKLCHAQLCPSECSKVLVWLRLA